MVDAGKSQREVARTLGVHVKTVFQAIRACRRRAALKGHSPEHDMTHVCPDTHYVKGVSTLYDGDGEKRLQWVKTSVDQEKMIEFARELADSVCRDVRPAKPKAVPKGKLDANQLAVYPIGDAHIGLYCWTEDSEEDYDLEIAQKLMRNGFSRVLASTPNTSDALIVNLGDWFHSDNQSNVTSRSGNRLDVDTRWAKVLRTGVYVLRSMIDEALAKHRRVHVINEIGNHDDHSAVMLSTVLDAYNAKEKRLTVDTSPDCFHWYEFGQNLIGVHHGHQCKPDQLYKVMAEDKREAFGRCKHRYWYIGHVHNARRQDVGGVVVESFRTLIPRDAWTHGAGFRSGRDICSIVLDSEHGEMFRATVNVEALR
jgi:hypothetical protein